MPIGANRMLLIRYLETRVKKSSHCEIYGETYLYILMNNSSTRTLYDLNSIPICNRTWCFYYIVPNRVPTKLEFTETDFVTF